MAHAESEWRRGRANEVVAQVLPQVPFWSSLVPLSPWRTPWSFELLGAALKFGNEVCHRLKHELALPRPSELSPFVQPILQTPGWAALPSGHATEAFLFAGLISRLMGLDPGGDTHKALQRQATSIADNRVWAGLHYPMDGIAGRLLGQSLAEYVVARCAGTPWTPRSFDGQHRDLAQADLEWSLTASQGAGCGESAPVQGPEPSPMLAYLWDRARAEFKGLGYV